MTIRLQCLYLMLSISFCACNQKKPDTGERLERYENGQISRRYQVINGKRDGLMTDYYNDGHVMAERLFKNGKQEGRTLIYYPGGQIKEVQYYLDGKREGGDTLWYENGKIQFTTMLKADKKNGYLCKWDTAGQKIYEAKYAMDTLIEVKGEPIGKNNPAARPSNIIKRKE